MLTIFDFDSEFGKKFIDTLIDDKKKDYISKHSEDEDICCAPLNIIIDHHFNNKCWWVIYQEKTRRVFCVGEMIDTWLSTCKKTNGTYAALILGYGFDSYDIRDCLKRDDESLKPLYIQEVLKESFSNVFDSSLIDYSNDFHNADLAYIKEIYHPEVIDDINDSFEKMRYVRDVFMPKVKEYKISHCSIKSRMPKKFRVGSYIHKQGCDYSDTFIEWSILYNYKVGSKEYLGHFGDDYYKENGDIMFNGIVAEGGAVERMQELGVQSMLPKSDYDWKIIM